LPPPVTEGGAEQVESQARDDLMSQLNESYNANADTCSGRRLNSMKPVAR